MIYLLKSYGPNNAEMLKVGYTEDFTDSLGPLVPLGDSKRFGTYDYHNPGIEIVAEVSRLGKECEFKLILAFTIFGERVPSRLPGRLRNEWFYFSTQLIDLFNSYLVVGFDLSSWVKDYVPCISSVGVDYMLSNLKGTDKKELLRLARDPSLLTPINAVEGLGTEITSTFILRPKVMKKAKLTPELLENILSIALNGVGDWVSAKDLKASIKSAMESLGVQGTAKASMVKGSTVYQASSQVKRVGSK